MNLIGITGAFGSGKSLFALEYGLSLANKYKKKLVVNFDVDDKYIRLYCKRMGFNWFLKCGRIVRIFIYDDLMSLWRIPHRGGHSLNTDSVTIFDEGGVSINSRSWSSVPKDFNRYLFQIRKLNVHMLLIFQFQDQIDKQMRQVVQRWIICKSSSLYDLRLKKPRIFSRLVLWYDADRFDRLQGNSQARSNIVMPFFWAESWEVSLFFLYYIFASLIRILKPSYLSRIDLIFKCFDSGKLVGIPEPVYALSHFVLDQSSDSLILDHLASYNPRKRNRRRLVNPQPVDIDLTAF